MLSELKRKVKKTGRKLDYIIWRFALEDFDELNYPNKLKSVTYEKSLKNKLQLWDIVSTTKVIKNIVTPPGSVLLCHYPGNMTKLYFSLNNSIPYVIGNTIYGYVYYTAGTDAGSSGAAILDHKCHLIGMHHSNLFILKRNSNHNNERCIWNMGSLFAIIIEDANEKHAGFFILSPKDAEAILEMKERMIKDGFLEKGKRIVRIILGKYDVEDYFI